MIAHGALAVLEREDTDETLVERVRLGDNNAFEDLYRRHSRLAVSVARKMLRSPQDAEDAAAEAFTNVLSALRRQVGPKEMFRPYLLACVRNTCLQRIRRSKQACTRDRSMMDVDVMDDDKVVEGAVAAAAFRSMPARWQSALWMAEVQHLDPLTIAERLDVNVASAGALVYRARQCFTEAYLAQHLSRAGRPACAALGPKLAQYVRGTAGLMATRQVENHIDECAACAAAVAELSDVNSSLRSLTGPLSVVAAAGATAAMASGGASTAAVSGIGLGWLAKAAAIAALSAAPLFVSGEGPRPALAASQATTNVDAHAEVSIDAHLKRPIRPHAQPDADNGRPDMATSSPAVPPGSRNGAGASVLPADGVNDLAGPLPLPAVVPPVSTALPTADDVGTTVDSVAGDLGGALTTLPALGLPNLTIPSITIPSISTPAISTPAIGTPAVQVLPPISVPPIAGLPAITMPPILVPSITVPSIVVPSIVLPAFSLPTISVPAIPHLPLPLLGSAGT